MTKVILGVLGLEVASGWGEPSYHVSLKVDHLVPEEIFLVSLFFPSADSLYHRAEWQRHLKSQTGEISFPKARSLGDRCYQTPKRQFSRSGCLPLLLPPAKFWDRIYSFWELSCETTSGSEKIYLFVIWGWGEHRIDLTNMASILALIFSVMHPHFSLNNEPFGHWLFVMYLITFLWKILPFTTAHIRKVNVFMCRKTCCKLLNLEALHLKGGHVKCHWQFSKD